MVLSPAQAKRHARWVAQRVYLNWLAPYFKAYHLRKGGAAGTRGFQVQLVQEQGSQGALLLYHASIGPGNFRHFFEHLGERLVDLGYHRACADKLANQHEHHTETTLKQFFKPNPTDCPNRALQPAVRLGHHRLGGCGPPTRIYSHREQSRSRALVYAGLYL
ncbi:hypothetical protein [Hymenobacter glacialis]|uniref:Uncharacterized protein n=1 Tax=Hymenobacter glacialis TaxID=1908236 RepID=A0A1G1T7M6_9BACT|nr:hypothetical protein [Hymenobacter glacialis]OGX86873.1 hypothetical protein BEN48_00470 [Hymenobacter glacialis]